jgi:hypothetical protein
VSNLRKKATLTANNQTTKNFRQTFCGKDSKAAGAGGFFGSVIDEKVNNTSSKFSSKKAVLDRKKSPEPMSKFPKTLLGGPS